MSISKYLLQLGFLVLSTLAVIQQDFKNNLNLQTFTSHNKKKLTINPGILMDHDQLISSLISSQINIQNFSHSTPQSYHLARHVFRQFEQSVISGSSGNSHIDSLTFSSDGVFSTIVIPGDTQRKYLAILDTGSNDIVFPLPSFPATMNTFKPLTAISSLSKTYRTTFKCPSFVNSEFICTKEGYVGVGYNSILGKDIIRFPDSNLGFNEGGYHTVFYFLNTLYGFNPNLAIIGIGFDGSGMRASSSLFESFSDIMNYEIKQINEEFNVKDADTIFPKLEKKTFKKGSFKTNVAFDKREYKNTALTKFINHISSVSFKGITIIKPSSKCTEMGCSSSNSNQESLVDEQVILDSGTNGLILSTNVFVEFVKSVKEIADPELEIFRNSDKIYFICWVADNNYSFLMDFGSFKLKVPLTTAELIETDEDKQEGKKSKQCSYINLMSGTSTNILGYPYWKLFDVIFDGENMGLYIKKGVTCTGECGLISK